MLVEQAIFTSAQTQNNSGYHVVAASPGIDHKLAQALAMWSPSQNGLIDRDIHADSLNCFPLSDEWIGVSRTVYGGAEYSDRGEFRLETNVLVLRHSQFAGYGHNPLAVARVARAGGHLRLRTKIPQQLAAIELPSQCGGGQRAARGRTPDKSCGEDGDPAASPIAQLVDQVADRCLKQRIVVVGIDDPTSFVSEVIAALPAPLVARFSFTTGLKPSAHRPFALQFLPAVNEALVRELAAREMACLMADAETVATVSD